MQSRAGRAAIAPDVVKAGDEKNDISSIQTEASDKKDGKYEFIAGKRPSVSWADDSED